MMKTKLEMRHFLPVQALLIIVIMTISSCGRAQSDDLLIARVKINNVIPIGWGILQNCELLTLINGKMPELEGNWIVGTQDFSKDAIEMEEGKEYQLTFKKTDNISETTYLPAGTHGFMDKDRRIWELQEIVPIAPQE